MDSSVSVYRTSLCPVCSKELHSCKNCRFYEVGSHYDCHETIDELVKDKEAANFCDSFSVKTTFSSSAKGDDKAQKARDAFASLFGN